LNYFDFFQNNDSIISVYRLLLLLLDQFHEFSLVSKNGPVIKVNIFTTR